MVGRVKKDGSAACPSLHIIPGLMIN